MQERIINLLEKEKSPLSRSEIALKLNSSEITVSLRLKKLIDHKEILFLEVGKDEALIKYGCQRRLRLYYIK